MSTFTAEGKLLLPEDGGEVASVVCAITLREPTRSQRGEWHGTLAITGDQKEFQRVHLQQGEFILTLRDGRQGRIIVTNAPVTAEGIGTISFQGSGRLE